MLYYIYTYIYGSIYIYVSFDNIQWTFQIKGMLSAGSVSLCILTELLKFFAQDVQCTRNQTGV